VQDQEYKEPVYVFLNAFFHRIKQVRLLETAIILKC
jgi:hypothetical protein